MNHLASDYFNDQGFRTAVDQQIDSALYFQQLKAADRANIEHHSHHHDFSKLAHAGIVGFIILAVIAVVAGTIAMLPKPLRGLLAIAIVGWIVWTCVTYKPTPEANVNAPRAELVQLPVVNTPAPRAVLVNPYPKY
jgi:hypothetical protein